MRDFGPNTFAPPAFLESDAHSDRPRPGEGLTVPFFLLLFAVAVGLLRVVGVKAIAFQAVAHLYVGGLIGAAVVAPNRRARWGCAALAFALSVLETICFFYGVK